MPSLVKATINSIIMCMLCRACINILLRPRRVLPHAGVPLDSSGRPCNSRRVLFGFFQRASGLAPINHSQPRCTHNEENRRIDEEQQAITVQVVPEETYGRSLGEFPSSRLNGVPQPRFSRSFFDISGILPRAAGIRRKAKLTMVPIMPKMKDSRSDPR